MRNAIACGCSNRTDGDETPSFQWTRPAVVSERNPTAAHGGNGGPRQAALATRAIISHMPAPINERQALERERAELPAHVVNYQRELDATPQEQKERRERLEWRIRRAKKRMAEVEARLALPGEARE